MARLYWPSLKKILRVLVLFRVVELTPCRHGHQNKKEKKYNFIDHIVQVAKNKLDYSHSIVAGGFELIS